MNFLKLSAAACLLSLPLCANVFYTFSDSDTASWIEMERPSFLSAPGSFSAANANIVSCVAYGLPCQDPSFEFALVRASAPLPNEFLSAGLVSDDHTVASGVFLGADLGDRTGIFYAYQPPVGDYRFLTIAIGYLPPPPPVTSSPEPASILLAAAGLLVFWMIRKRRALNDA